MAAGDRIEMHVNYEYEYRDDFTDNLLAATLRLEDLKSIHVQILQPG